MVIPLVYSSAATLHTPGGSLDKANSLEGCDPCLCVPNRSVPSQKILLVSPKLPSPKATSTFGGVRVFAVAVVR